MSTVATEEKPVAADKQPAERHWTRTPEQQALVDDYLAMIAEQYAGADPALVAALTDPTILGTEEVKELLGYTGRTRVFQLYSKSSDLADDDQVPHPSAIPEADATAGKRGARAIRGVMRGRANHWAIQSTRQEWDPFQKKIVPQEDINPGGAPKKS